jgi:tetratricopeptide (TPR) repeat protein
MQKLYMVLLLAVMMVPFMACEDKKKPMEELLDRKGPISTTTEWINTKAAIRTLQDDIRRKPNAENKKLMLALAYMQEARITGEHPHYYPLAQDLLDEVISSRPHDNKLLFEALVAKAIVQLSLHQFKEALNTANHALKLDTTTASLYGVFCDAYVELGDYPKAIIAADRMTAIRPDIRSYSRISYLREIHGDVQGAIEAMKEAILSGMPGLEQTAWARITLGELYENIGQLEEAEIQYKMALAERPQYPFAIGSLGRLEAKKKNYAQAIELLKKASGIIPEFSFQQELASIYKVTGKKNIAKSVTEDLLESLEEDQEAGHTVNLELANIHFDITENLDEAYSFAKKEYKERPGNIDVCKTMAKIFYKKNNLEEAKKLIEKASRTNKQDAEIVSLKGLIIYKLGDREKGIELMNKALQLNPFLNETIVKEINRLTQNKFNRLHEK